MTNVFFSNKLLTLNKEKNKPTNSPDNYVFGQKMGVMTKLFGCWHNNISRPFAEGKTAYRSCLQCGARKRFDPETLETYGSFYFPPAVKEQQI